MKLCCTCGNEIDNCTSVCPYCKTPQSDFGKPIIKSSEKIITLNLEHGLPPVDQALDRLEREIVRYKGSDVRLIRVIHGYGSSGKGGKIRETVVQRLRAKKRTGTIRDYLTGDHYTGQSDYDKKLLAAFPDLVSSFKTDRMNKGITFILL
ncbi:MAG: Smr/MutS family protein [Syntrophaceae bacterium]|nr:Smr/MutS family protein [Syntrophaceae bacterium]